MTDARTPTRADVGAALVAAAVLVAWAGCSRSPVEPAGPAVTLRTAWGSLEHRPGHCDLVDVTEWVARGMERAQLERPETDLSRSLDGYLIEGSDTAAARGYAGRHLRARRTIVYACGHANVIAHEVGHAAAHHLRLRCAAEVWHSTDLWCGRKA